MSPAEAKNPIRSETLDALAAKNGVVLQDLLSLGDDLFQPAAIEQIAEAVRSLLRVDTAAR